MTQYELRARTRRRIGSKVAEGFFSGVSRLGQLHPRANPHEHGVRRIRDVPYAASGDRAHLLDVYLPVDPPSSFLRGGKLPIVLYVHGGGFRILSKDTHWLPALAFARRGYLVFNISYRLAPLHPFPAALMDCVEALRWVSENAVRFGGDLDRVALAGESAGANLVTALAICTHFARPEPWAMATHDLPVQIRAVLPAAGLLQVSDPQRFSRPVPLRGFMQDRIDEVTSAYLPKGGGHDLADPLLVLERETRPIRPLPPFYCAAGTADPIADDTRRLETALLRRDVRHQASYFEGEHHAFHMFVFREAARQCWQEMLGFTHHHVATC